MDRVRYQLFLPRCLSDRLEALAARPGVTRSAILADALEAWLTRGGASELEDRFSIRLDRLTGAIGRVERDAALLLEAMALFVRYELAIHPPLAPDDRAGRALGQQRFEVFIERVANAVATGRRTIALSVSAPADPIAEKDL
jgi:predicted DNA-binding protein